MGKKEIGATRFSLGDPLLPLCLYIFSLRHRQPTHRTFVAFVGICLGHSPHLPLFLPLSLLLSSPLHITPPPRSEKVQDNVTPRALKLAFEIFSADVISGDGSSEAGPVLRDALPLLYSTAVDLWLRMEIPVGLCFISHLALVVSSRFVTAVELDSPVDP